MTKTAFMRSLRRVLYVSKSDAKKPKMTIKDFQKNTTSDIPQLDEEYYSTSLIYS